MGIIRILFYSSVSSLKVDGNLRIESKHKDGSRPTRSKEEGVAVEGSLGGSLFVLPLQVIFDGKTRAFALKMSSDTDFSAAEQNMRKKMSHGDIGDLTMTQIPLEFEPWNYNGKRRE